MIRQIVWILAVASALGCGTARPDAAPREPGTLQDRPPDLSGTWRGRLSLYSAEINDLHMELQLGHEGEDRVGRAEIEVTDEPGGLHHVATGLSWHREGAAVVIRIGEEISAGSPALVFEGTLVGEGRIAGRLDGWGIRNARFTLVQQAD